jgi:hypothetical protein
VREGEGGRWSMGEQKPLNAINGNVTDERDQWSSLKE